MEISGELWERTRQHAHRTGQSLRALIEKGLRLVLQSDLSPSRYRLLDRSVGNPGDPNPLDSFSWPNLRDEIYQGR